MLSRVRWPANSIHSSPILFAVGILSLMASGSLARAAEHTASPTGRPTAAGTRSDPWDLRTALSQRPSIRPGDTIWLSGGVYRGGFTSDLTGAPDAPIVVRALPGARVTIDCQTVNPHQSALFEVNGAWTDYRDFEVTCDDRKRSTAITGSWPEDINRGGIDCHGSHCRFINLVVHDTNEGFGFWSEAEGGEIYGCLIYHNGWQAADRGHGHAIYSQNRTGTKRLADNILFEQFGFGVHVYGSSRAFLQNFDIEGNTAFNNGAPSEPRHETPGIFVGGETPARQIRMISNCTYGYTGGDVLLGYPWGPENEDAVVRDNIIVGSANIIDWSQMDFSHNIIVNRGVLLSLDRRSHTPALLSINQNTYYQAGGHAGFNLDKHDCDWPAWRQTSGQDSHSTLHPGPPTGTWVSVRPNQYDPGRANIVVYNWGRRDSIAVDLARVLRKGDRFRIVWAQDYYGKPVVSGTFNGAPVTIPMAPRVAPRPIGLENYQSPPTLPEFGAFVLLSKTRTVRGSR